MWNGTVLFGLVSELEPFLVVDVLRWALADPSGFWSDSQCPISSPFQHRDFHLKSAICSGLGLFFCFFWKLAFLAFSRLVGCWMACIFLDFDALHWPTNDGMDELDILSRYVSVLSALLSCSSARWTLDASTEILPLFPESSYQVKYMLLVNRVVSSYHSVSWTCGTVPQIETENSCVIQFESLKLQLRNEICVDFGNHG